MALSAISMNSASADKEFVLSLHHKLHVSTCINKPNDAHKHNQSIIHSNNQGAQWFSGSVLDSRPRGREFEPHRRHCVVILEQDTFILA